MSQLKLFSFALSALLFLHACNADSGVAGSVSLPDFKELPFSTDLQYLNKPLYELMDSGKSPDATISHEVMRLLKPIQAKDRFIYKKIMSGPEPKGKYIVTQDKNQYVYFEACQAHQCNTLTMGLLYDVQLKSAVGLLRAVCDEKWLGMEENDSKKYILKKLLPVLDDSDKTDCDVRKSGK
jgi:hypothetical protein